MRPTQKLKIYRVNLVTLIYPVKFQGTSEANLTEVSKFKTYNPKFRIIVVNPINLVN